MSGFGFPSSAQNSQAHNPNKDIEIASPPTDGISSLCWSSKANHLVATSWDNQIRFWEVQPNGGSVPKAAVSHDQPVLCSTWSPDGSTVFSGGCSKQAMMWNLATNQNQVVGQHDAPIKHIFFVEAMSNMLVTASWDRSIRYWDLRQPKPAHQQPMPERIYAMDIRYPLAVVGCANRRVSIFNLTNPAAVYKDEPSPLKYQTRCLTAFPDTTGYLIGSIEGRVAVQHVEEQNQSKNFTFKCHRDGSDIFAINSITFHPKFGTFVTTGSDGNFNFWDKDSKQRLKNMSRCSMPIPCGAFNADGSIYAYAVSYDWSKGYAEHNPATAKNHILLHAPSDTEVKTRPRPTGRR